MAEKQEVKAREKRKMRGIERKIEEVEKKRRAEYVRKRERRRR